jgi:hyperosmotically inducible periplasmic protein
MNMKKIISTILLSFLFALTTSPSLANEQQPKSLMTKSAKWDNSDQYMEVQLRTIFATNPVLSKYNLKTSYSDHKVTIEGKVKNADEKELALNIAKAFYAVKEVKDKIIIDPTIKPGQSKGWVASVIDSTITAMVKSALAADLKTSATDIKVKTANGVVTLEGTVKSQEEIDEAEKLAIRIPGVITVKNNLVTNNAT